MHNGGAYGDGTTESGAGIKWGAAGATGKHVQFPLASGGTGDSGANRFAERGGKGLSQRQVRGVLYLGATERANHDRTAWPWARLQRSAANATCTEYMRGTSKIRTIMLSRESIKSTMVLRRAIESELRVWCDESSV